MLDSDELISEWKIFKHALLLERKSLMERKNDPVPSPTMHDLLKEMKTSSTYEGVFPQTWKLLNIMMALHVSTASVERIFSQMRFIKTRLRSRLSDSNLEHNHGVR